MTLTVAEPVWIQGKLRGVHLQHLPHTPGTDLSPLAGHTAVNDTRYSVYNIPVITVENTLTLAA